MFSYWTVENERESWSIDLTYPCLEKFDKIYSVAIDGTLVH